MLFTLNYAYLKKQILTFRLCSVNPSSILSLMAIISSHGFPLSTHNICCSQTSDTLPKQSKNQQNQQKIKNSETCENLLIPQNTYKIAFWFHFFQFSLTIVVKTKKKQTNITLINHTHTHRWVNLFCSLTLNVL